MVLICIFVTQSIFMKKLILISFAAIISSGIFAQTPGNALNFDGANDMVVATVPPLFSNLNTNSFTYEAWVYPTGAIFSRIIYAQFSTTSFATMSTGGTNNIYFYVVAGGTNYSIATTANMPSNQWTHVACVWNASTLTPQVYFNGVFGDVFFVCCVLGFTSEIAERLSFHSGN